MLSYKEIEVPDANEFRNVSVKEILVKEGEQVEVVVEIRAQPFEAGQAIADCASQGRVPVDAVVGAAYPG